MNTNLAGMTRPESIVLTSLENMQSIETKMMKD